MNPDLHLRLGGGGGGGGGVDTFKGLTMNVEFCEDDSGSSKKNALFPKKNKWGEGGFPGSVTVIHLRVAEVKRNVFPFRFGYGCNVLVRKLFSLYGI